MTGPTPSGTTPSQPAQSQPTQSGPTGGSGPVPRTPDQVTGQIPPVPPTGPPGPWTNPADGAGPRLTQLRFLSIAANLLPDELLQGRRERQVKRSVLAGMLAVVVLLAGWYGLSLVRTASAKTDLEAAQASATSLLRQQQAFGEVVRVRAQSTAISNQLAILMQQDMSWASFVAAVERAAPAGVNLTTLTSTLNSPADVGAADGGENTASGLPSTAGRKVVGSITLNGVGISKPAVAAYSDALTAVTGTDNPMISTVALAEGALWTFTIKADITGAALGGRWSGPAGNATAKATK